MNDQPNPAPSGLDPIPFPYPFCRICDSYHPTDQACLLARPHPSTFRGMLKPDPAPDGSAVDALTAADLLDGSTCGELDCDTCNDQRELGARLLRTQAAKLAAAERRVESLEGQLEAARFQIGTNDTVIGELQEELEAARN